MRLKHICFDLQFTRLFCVVSCCFCCCCLFPLPGKSERGPLTNMVVGRESHSLHESSLWVGQEQSPVLRSSQKSGTTYTATSRHRHKEEIMWGKNTSPPLFLLFLPFACPWSNLPEWRHGRKPSQLLI